MAQIIYTYTEFNSNQGPVFSESIQRKKINVLIRYVGISPVMDD